MFRGEPAGATYVSADLNATQSMWPGPSVREPVNERAGMSACMGCPGTGTPVCGRVSAGSRCHARQREPSHQPVTPHSQCCEERKARRQGQTQKIDRTILLIFSHGLFVGFSQISVVVFFNWG